MPQSFVAAFYHLIWSTKARVAQIDADLAPRMYEYLGGLLRARNSHLLAAGGMPDHVHLLVSLSKELALSEAMREIKALSSKWVHETFPKKESFGWQTGYGAFSVSLSNVEAVKAYLAGQAEHHKARTFQEEFVEFLRRHQIPYDPKYIWE